MNDPPDDAFTLQTMLDLRQAVEEVDDEAGRGRPLAAFTAYAEAFVAHVPRDDGEAVESLLLARYFSFLPLLPADVAATVRADLEAVLGHLTGGDASIEVVDALWRVRGGLADLAEQGRWNANEQDVPIATVVGNVLIWARGALSA